MIGALLRFVFRSILATVLMRIVGRFFPALRRVLRIVWR
jgi:hypothetical protein